MERKPILADTGLLRCSLGPAAAALLSLSALAGLAGVVLLFDPAYASILRSQMIDGGITSRSALDTWTAINTAITVLCFICPAITSWCLWTSLRGRSARGLGLLSTAAQWLLYGLHGIAALALGYFLIRLTRYILRVLPMNEAAYLLYSMLISEALMVVLAFLLYRLTVRFLTSAADTAASIGYTLSSGKLDTLSIPPMTALGLTVLGFVNLGLAVSRLFTVTIVQAYSGDYYGLLTAGHPGQYLAAAALLSGALGNFCLAQWLRRYNRLCEQARFAYSRNLLK